MISSCALPVLQGVASGDPFPNSVILWARVTPKGGLNKPAFLDYAVAHAGAAHASASHTSILRSLVSNRRGPVPCSPSASYIWSSLLVVSLETLGRMLNHLLAFWHAKHNFDSP